MQGASSAVAANALERFSLILFSTFARQAAISKKFYMGTWDETAAYAKGIWFKDGKKRKTEAEWEIDDARSKRADVRAARATARG